MKRSKDLGYIVEIKQTIENYFRVVVDTDDEDYAEQIACEKVASGRVDTDSSNIIDQEVISIEDYEFNNEY